MPIVSSSKERAGNAEGAMSTSSMGRIRPWSDELPVAQSMLPAMFPKSPFEGQYKRESIPGHMLCVALKCIDGSYAFESSRIDMARQAIV